MTEEQITNKDIKINSKEGVKPIVGSGKGDLIIHSPNTKPNIYRPSEDNAMCENRDRKGGYLVP